MAKKSKPPVPDFTAYPVRVTLRFRTPEARREFLGGLSDGWGENHCTLDWVPKPGKRNLSDADEITVDPIPLDEDDE